MDKDERNEHFKEFAHLHYPELSQLFFTMYARISELRPIEEIDAIELEIKTLIAQRAYDLVRHAMYCNHINSSYWPGSPNFGQASPMYEHDTTARTNDVPDLAAWPEPPTMVE